MFERKKIIIFAEGDEIEKLTIETCLKAAGVNKEDIVYSHEDCFT